MSAGLPDSERCVHLTRLPVSAPLTTEGAYGG